MVKTQAVLEASKQSKVSQVGKHGFRQRRTFQDPLVVERTRLLREFNEAHPQMPKNSQFEPYLVRQMRE